MVGLVAEGALTRLHRYKSTPLDLIRNGEIKPKMSSLLIIKTEQMTKTTHIESSEISN